MVKQNSCDWKCRFDGKKCNSKQTWDDDSCRSWCKKTLKQGIYEEGYVCNPRICPCKCGKKMWYW